MKLIYALLASQAILWGSVVQALYGVEPQVDKAAHAGVSYGITHSSYAVCKLVTDTKLPCLIGGVLMSTAIGAARELTGNKDKADMAANMVGITAASLMITISW